MNMNIFAFLGTVEARIIGFDSGLIINKLRKECNVISLYIESEAIVIKVPFMNMKKLNEITNKHGFLLEIIEEKGVYYYLRRYFKRFGIAAGALLFIFLSIYLSNIAFKVRIIGVNDPALEYTIRSTAAQEGAKAGAYIPSLNFLEIESKLMELSDDIAWASVGSSGSVITINVSEATKRVKSDAGRIPCNIVASHDGFIVSADVLAGEFTSLVGTAVRKGDVLVSGIVERRNKRAYYYHSIAKVIAEYSETIELEQSLYDRSIVDGEAVYQKHLSLFELDIPISITKRPSGRCKISVTEAPIKLFGVKLPIGIKTIEYREQTSKLKIYTKDEAKKILNDKIDTYEKNLLGNAEIINREIETWLEGDIMKLKAVYTLRGDIARESPIFVK